jgi:hypothetical protein
MFLWGGSKEPPFFCAYSVPVTFREHVAIAVIAMLLVPGLFFAKIVTI